MDSLIHSPEEQFADLATFLGLPLTPVDSLATSNVGVHKGEQHMTLSGVLRTKTGFEHPNELPARLCKELARFYQPHNEALYALLALWRSKDEGVLSQPFEAFGNVACAEDGDFDASEHVGHNNSQPMTYLHELLESELTAHGLGLATRSQY